jgi:hypothetical protein
MKKLLIITISIACLVNIINSCKKTGGAINPLSDVKNLTVGSYLVLDSTINLYFNNNQIATSSVGITVSGYKNGEAVDHIDLYVSADGTYDTTQWHKLKTVAYEGNGTKLMATGAEMAAALGVGTGTFVPGDSYTFYTRLFTKTGRTFDVNNTGNNAGSGLVTGPTYFGAYFFTTYITCPFTGGMAGTYKVLSEDKGDWHIGDLVTVKDGPGANQIDLSLVYPGAGGTIVKPLIVNVEPTTGRATIPLVTYGTYPSSASEFTAEGAGDNDVAGFIFSCTGYITLTIELQNKEKDLGPNRLILQKM